MDGQSKKRIGKYLGIWALFIILFSVFMYALASYEASASLRQMATLMTSHPDLEAEIVSVWGKPDHRLSLQPEDVASFEESIQIVEDKYGYKLNSIEAVNALWMFWGVGIFAGTLAALVFFCFDWRRSKYGVASGEKVQELYECLQQFRSGEFFDVPDYTKDSEEWMKLSQALRELGVYFADLRERLREEENSTKTLVTDISHQLKTPLASLRMSHELLMGGQLSEEEKQEFQRQEKKEIDKLELLLNELVKLSRLETHMIQIKPVMAGIRKTLTAAVSQNYMKARNKHIEIRMEMEGDIEICHDAKWTEEAVANVLDNAVKYSEEHTAITVRVKPLVSNLLIEVEDQGIGIKKEELSKIWQRFYRGREASQRVREGAGVGLYLARMILERQGGTISAERKIEKGTVLKLTLPLV